MLDIESLMAWAVALVAGRARSVMLLGSLSEAVSRPASSLASILSWKTGSTAIECSAEAACPASEPELVDSLRHNADELFIHSVSGIV